ncbi:1030_t:CDS:2, partial [Cetraspora pellucida]
LLNISLSYINTMANTQSKIDSLEEQNSKLVAEISELRKKYTKVEAENVKLRHITEESTGLKTRFEKLEKKNKTDTAILIAENIELKNRVTKLEQKRIQVITNESSTKDILPPSKSSESASSICTETKLLEDRKKISNEIRERNRENRFRSQDPLSYDKDISQSNKNKVQKFMSEVSGSSSSQLNRDALIQRRNEIASEQQVDLESNIVSRILNKEVKAQLPADTSDSLL